MKQLSKQQVKEWNEHVANVRGREEELVAAVDAYNSALAAAKSDLEAALGKLNAAIEDADGWREQLAADMESYASERSDAWTESDVGSAYHQWLSDWESELPRTELEFPDELESPECDAVVALEALADAPG